jgi:hypothetical protein
VQIQLVNLKVLCDDLCPSAQYSNQVIRSERKRPDLKERGPSKRKEVGSEEKE